MDFRAEFTYAMTHNGSFSADFEKVLAEKESNLWFVSGIEFIPDHEFLFTPTKRDFSKDALDLYVNNPQEFKNQYGSDCVVGLTYRAECHVYWKMNSLQQSEYSEIGLQAEYAGGGIGWEANAEAAFEQFLQKHRTSFNGSYQADSTLSDFRTGAMAAEINASLAADANPDDISREIPILLDKYKKKLDVPNAYKRYEVILQSWDNIIPSLLGQKNKQDLPTYDNQWADAVEQWVRAKYFQRKIDSMLSDAGAYYLGDNMPYYKEQRDGLDKYASELFDTLVKTYKAKKGGKLTVKPYPPILWRLPWIEIVGTPWSNDYSHDKGMYPRIHCVFHGGDCALTMVLSAEGENDIPFQKYKDGDNSEYTDFYFEDTSWYEPKFSWIWGGHAVIKAKATNGKTIASLPFYGKFQILADGPHAPKDAENTAEREGEVLEKIRRIVSMVNPNILPVFAPKKPN